MISPIDPDLPLLATVLARQWQYPPGYERLMLEALRLGLSELADPKKRAAAEVAARKAGLMTEDN